MDKNTIACAKCNRDIKINWKKWDAGEDIECPKCHTTISKKRKVKEMNYVKKAQQLIAEGKVKQKVVKEAFGDPLDEELHAFIMNSYGALDDAWEAIHQAHKAFKTLDMIKLEKIGYDTSFSGDIIKQFENAKKVVGNLAGVYEDFARSGMDYSEDEEVMDDGDIDNAGTETMEAKDKGCKEKGSTFSASKDGKVGEYTSKNGTIRWNTRK